MNDKSAILLTIWTHFQKQIEYFAENISVWIPIDKNGYMICMQIANIANFKKILSFLVLWENRLYSVKFVSLINCLLKLHNLVFFRNN